MTARSLAPLFLLFLLVLAASSLSGCKEEDNPFRRRPLAPENDTPQWRYYHNYSMFLHEHGVLEKALEATMVQVKASWARLREYLIGMRDNLPPDRAFDFLQIFKEYEEVMGACTDYRVNFRAALFRVRSLRKRIERRFSPKKIYPDFRPPKGR